jgi:hypothetical protein
MGSYGGTSTTRSIIVINKNEEQRTWWSFGRDNGVTSIAAMLVRLELQEHAR